MGGNCFFARILCSVLSTTASAQVQRCVGLPIFILLFSILPLFFGCVDDNPEIVPVQPVENEEGSWIKYSPYDWTHDGRPYHSVYCKVFSDGASDEMKEKAGIFTDAKFLEVLKFFNFSDYHDLRYPPEHDKIDVYLNTRHIENIMAAYWGSIIITVKTPDLDTTRYEYLFKHELTHQLEFLIEGMVNLGTDLWFREGIAIYGGGGMTHIENADDLDRWIAQNAHSPNKGNPITIHSWDDFPDDADVHGYFMICEVVINYLLDSNGLGKSKQDVLQLLYDVREGILFNVAFEENFGITLEDFENEIFARLRAYLM